MSERDSLLSNIRDNPDDDTVRLVYADWLEEHGESERAAFIRKQIEAFRLPEGDPRRLELENEADRLEAIHGAGWSVTPVDLTRREYVRGFQPALYSDYFNYGFGVHDIIQMRHCTALNTSTLYTQDITRLTEEKVLNHVHTLNLGLVSDSILEYLHGLPKLRRLSGTMSLSSAGGIARLVQLPLESLRLEPSSIRSVAIEALPILCDAPPLQQHLQNLSYRHRMLQPLADTLPCLEKLEKLTSLDIRGDSPAVNSEIAQRLSHLPRLQRQLEKLTIINTCDAETLARFTALKHLDLALTNTPSAPCFTRETLKQFLASDVAKTKLYRLHLIQTGDAPLQLDTECLQLLGQCRELRHLEFTGCTMDIETLAAQPLLCRQLQSLSIVMQGASHNAFSTFDARAVGKFEQLRTLSLHADMDSNELATLLRQPAMRSLRQLNLQFARIDDDMIRLLAQCPNLPYLRELDFQASHVHGVDDDNFQGANARLENVFANAFQRVNADSRVTLPSLHFVRNRSYCVDLKLPKLPAPTEDSFLGPGRRIPSNPPSGMSPS